MQDSNHIINEVTSGDYKYGFVTDIDTEVIHRGLDEETASPPMYIRKSLSVG